MATANTRDIRAFGAPSEIRTRVTGLKGRCCRQGANYESEDRQVTMTADSAEFEHPVRSESERSFREFPITQSSDRDHRRSAATSHRFGDTSPPLRMG